MEYDELLKLMKTRRTIRGIKPDPIPDETVDKILEAARWAPTGFNMQPLELLVIKDLSLRKAIKTDGGRLQAMTSTMEATRKSGWASPDEKAHGKHNLSRPQSSSPCSVTLGGRFGFRWP